MPPKPKISPWLTAGERHRPGMLLELLACAARHPLVQPSRKLRGEAALDYTWIPGTGRVVLVLGENGSGKSVLRRIVRAECDAAGAPMLSLSMEERGSVRALADYGMESVESTGTVSGRAVRRLLDRSASRVRPHIVFLDEPDIGMSDALAGGVGLEVGARETTGLPFCYGLFVTSHNRALVRALVANRDRTPHVLWFGPTGFDLATWLRAPVEARPLDVAMAHARRTESRVRLVLRGEAAHGGSA